MIDSCDVHYTRGAGDRGGSRARHMPRRLTLSLQEPLGCIFSEVFADVQTHAE